MEKAEYGSFQQCQLLEQNILESYSPRQSFLSVSDIICFLQRLFDSTSEARLEIRTLQIVSLTKEDFEVI